MSGDEGVCIQLGGDKGPWVLVRQGDRIFVNVDTRDPSNRMDFIIRGDGEPSPEARVKPDGDAYWHQCIPPAAPNPNLSRRNPPETARTDANPSVRVAARPIEPISVPVQVRIPPEIIAKLDRVAEHFGITRAALLRRILDDWADNVR